MSQRIDLTGMTFGRLTVTGFARSDKAGSVWACRCVCGTESEVNSLKLRKGLIVSCGCHRAERLRDAATTHGKANKSPTYRTWKEMRQRCTNPSSDKWKWYGGRGITVCSRWDSYENFLADMGERPPGKTLDRIDNDGPYSPENCQWATHIEQTRKQSTKKLSETLAEQMRQEHAAGSSYRELGRKYGVSATTAHRAVVGITWSQRP